VVEEGECQLLWVEAVDAKVIGCYQGLDCGLGAVRELTSLEAGPEHLHGVELASIGGKSLGSSRRASSEWYTGHMCRHQPIIGPQLPVARPGMK